MRCCPGWILLGLAFALCFHVHALHCTLNSINTPQAITLTTRLLVKWGFYDGNQEWIPR